MLTRNRLISFLTLVGVCAICIIAFARVLATQNSGSALSIANSEGLAGKDSSLFSGISSSAQLMLLGGVIIILLVFLGEFISKFLQAQKDKKLLEREIKLKNTKLNAAVEVLAMKNEELKKFNYILAHDMKEPVRIINAYSGLLAQKSIEDPELQNHINQIMDSSKQLSTLIQDAGNYMDLGKESSSLEEIDSQALIVSVRSELASLIEDSNAEIITHDLPRLVTNAESLRYILSSLIENGIIYNESSSPQILVYYKSTTNYHYFYVSDNGLGVESEYEDKIFEMFQRLHTKDVFPGTGLGLSGCVKLAKSMNGKLTLHKSSDQGSTFMLKFRKAKLQKEYSSQVS